MTSLGYVCRQTAINQALGLRVVRRLLDTLGSRPSLAPVRRDDDDIFNDPFEPELPLRKFRAIRAAVGDDDLCRGKVVAEIGCGMSLGMGIVGLALGARRALMLDRERYLLPDPRSAASHRRLLDMVPDWVPNADPRYRTAVRIDGDRVAGDGDNLAYVLAPGECLPLRDRSVDLVVSHSTLEHVADLDEVVAELSRVAAPGGRSIHHVDLSDHLDSAHPLRMLHFSRRTWQLIASNRRGWTNRLRLPDFLRSFARHGLEIERLNVLRPLTAPQLAAIRPELHEEFRGLADEDLAPLGFLCVLRRS